MKKAVFLDRDGVINHDHGYVHQWEQFDIYDDVIPFLLRVSKAGYVPIIVTNQSGIARGLYTEKDFHNLMANFNNYLQDLKLNKIRYYYCPHSPLETQKCKCRKPKPGMLIQAKKDLNICMSKSIMIGDRGTDVQCSLAAKVGSTYLLDRRGDHRFTHTEKSATVIKNLLDVNWHT